MAPSTTTAGLAASVAWLALAGPASAANPPCAGRFLVAVGRLAIHRPAFDVIQVGPDGVTLDVVCAKPVVSVKARRSFTAVRARWSVCGAVRRLRVAARIAGPACDEMTGTMRATGMGRQRFAAHLSACGDRVFDPAVEACDAGRGCEPGQTCTASCTCTAVVGATTTSTTTTEPGATTTVETGTTTSTTLEGADCHVLSIPYEGATHVPVGTDIVWQNNPPASGSHYPVWTTYEDHADVVPRGYWVHNLEHGAIVLLYRPDAPEAVIEAVRAGWRAIPDDPECGHKRTLLTADPLLDVPFAAVAWTYVMECGGIVDTQSILDFTAEHRNHGREDDCVQGAYE